MRIQISAAAVEGEEESANYSCNFALIIRDYILYVFEFAKFHYNYNSISFKVLFTQTWESFRNFSYNYL